MVSVECISLSYHCKFKKYMSNYHKSGIICIESLSSKTKDGTQSLHTEQNLQLQLDFMFLTVLLSLYVAHLGLNLRSSCFSFSEFQDYKHAPENPGLYSFDNSKKSTFTLNNEIKMNYIRRKLLLDQQVDSATSTKCL